MSLNRLRWVTIVLAITFLLCVQGVAMGFVMPQFGRIYGHAVSVTAFSVGVVVFTVAIFRVIDVMQRRIVRQNEELSAVNAVSRSVAGPLDLDESMAAALGDLMQVTRALAGQITVTPDGGGRPVSTAMVRGRAGHPRAPSAANAASIDGHHLVSVASRVRTAVSERCTCCSVRIRE
jgi:hypothetical protein